MSDLEHMKVFALLLENGKNFHMAVARKVVLCDLDIIIKVLFCAGIVLYDSKQLNMKTRAPFIWQINNNSNVRKIKTKSKIIVLYYMGCYKL